ncbi:hypothetical protein [Cloacibacterium sp.]|uniref:hypothetical protein n=1 Tax=Cloacibacterium sp. TaxID=1913682 RepID=UPI0039E49DE4
MKHLIKYLTIISLFLSFIQCKKNTEKDEYEIANLILKRNITAFGIKIFPPKKIVFGSIEHKKFNDSLVNNLKLTYYLYPNFYKLDTLKYYKSKKALDDSENFLNEKLDEIDFSKIKNLKIKRINSIPYKDEIFGKKYDNLTGLYTISDIIFNEKMTIAYCEINISCGGKCGKGIKYELKKINGIWKIIKEELLWIS